MAVYAIRRKDDTTGPIKIGYASDVDKRIRSFATATPEGFDILAVIPGGRVLEKTLHRELSSFNVGGEWFETNEIVLGAIEAAANSNLTSVEDTWAAPRPIMDEPTLENPGHIVDESRYYLNDLMKREWAGPGDTIRATRDRVMASIGMPASLGFRLWNKSQEMNDVPGELYKRLRMKYALAKEADGTLNEMQWRFLSLERRLESVKAARVAEAAKGHEEA